MDYLIEELIEKAGITSEQAVKVIKHLSMQGHIDIVKLQHHEIHSHYVEALKMYKQVDGIKDPIRQAVHDTAYHFRMTPRNIYKINLRFEPKSSIK